jgi:hypothetical protein
LPLTLQIPTIYEGVKIICPLIVLQLGHLKWEEGVGRVLILKCELASYNRENVGTK